MLKSESLISRFSRVLDHLSSEGSCEAALREGRRKLGYLQSQGIELIFRSDSSYPRRLDDLRDPPQWLFVEGNADALGRSSVAAVGSRKVTPEGRWLANYFGYSLPELGVTTVSGLAEGVDQIVHRSSLAVGLPTVAVLGTGILLNYPSGSEGLRRDIVNAGGCVITEYLPNDSFSARNFVRRNRIQAALGQVVFPIEWGVKSGTAHTVKFSSELGRPLVFAATPTQPSLDWIPPEFLQHSARFLLPKEHDRFVEFIRKGLTAGPIQKTLF